jgi:hypothetical protein
MSKLQELERRRETLIVRSGGQRERLAESYRQLAHSLRWASLAKSFLLQIKEHPVALIGPAATIIAGPGKFRRLGNVLSLGWSILSAVRSRRRR